MEILIGVTWNLQIAFGKDGHIHDIPSINA